MDWYPEDRHGTAPTSSDSGNSPPSASAPSVTSLMGPDGPRTLPSAACTRVPHAADAGLPDGLRKSADPRKANTNTMAAFAKATTLEEDRAAADTSRSSRTRAA